MRSMRRASTYGVIGVLQVVKFVTAYSTSQFSCPLIMRSKTSLLALVCLFCLAKSDKPDLCGPRFEGKCVCSLQAYDSVQSFVVNCTNSGFNNPDIFQHLPRETEVIIFYGNNFSTLPPNVFGVEKENVPVGLHTIDLANNHIMDIAGKAFHHVPFVKKLVLNHNRIRFSSHGPEHVHGRVFSNFLNLTELQLINAFEDNINEDFPSALHEVFLNSNLPKLTHLHLESNHLQNIERKTFCTIHELKKLYLDGNDLTDLNFDILCLQHLEHISLKSNNIDTLNHGMLNILESFPARNQSLKVDLQCNRWICNSAANLNVTRWFKSKNVTLVGKYSCSAGNPGCTPDKLGLYNSDLSVMAQILIVLTVIVFCIIGAVCFFKGTQIRNKFNPLLDTVSHKMQYTTLRRREEPEVDV